MPAASDASAPPPPDRWSRRRVGIYVALVVAALFAPTLVFHRVGYDDMWLWGDDSPLRSLDGHVLRTMFFELDGHLRRPYGAEYLPVRDLVVALDMAAWGDGERGPHLTQLVLYAATVYGMGRMLIAWGLRSETAWLGTLLWAIHPLHVESVAWVSERKGILAGLFVVLCGHAWLRYRKDRPWYWLALAALAAIAGVWSKAPAMFVPPVFAVWDLLLLPGGRRRWIAIAAVGLATALAAAPVFAVARDVGVIDNDTEMVDQPRVVRMLGAQGHYVKGLVLAQPPSLAYDLQTDGATAFDVALGVVAVLGSAALAWYARRNRWLLALLAWAWITFFPISHLATPVHILAADRFVYLWTLAACVGVAALVGRLRGTARLAAAGAIVCVLGVATIRAEGAWASSIELFSRAVATSPGDPKACQNLADALFAEGERKRAFAELEHCLERRSDAPYVHDKQARLLAAAGRLPEALEASARAASFGKAGTMWYHATLLARAGRLDEALDFAERAARKRPSQQHLWTWVELLVQAKRTAFAEPLIAGMLAREPSAPTALIAAKVAIARGDRPLGDERLDLALALGANPKLVAELRR